jgi:superfamily II DNA/RNA helicase
VLIATDLVARGLDFDDITHVVNFDLPEVPERIIVSKARVTDFKQWFTK